MFPKQEPMQSIKYGVTERVYQDNYGDHMVHIIGHKIPGNYISEKPNDIIYQDIFYNQVTLLLHLDSNFSDSSRLNTTLSSLFFAGTLPTISSEQSRFGGGSVFITQNSRSGYTTPSTSNYFFNSDFTFEFWIHPTILPPADNTGRLFGYINNPNDLSNRWTIIQMSNGQFRLFGNSGLIITSTQSAPLNTWTHVALCRSGSLYSFFINGLLSGSVVNTSTLVNPGGYIHLFGASWSGDTTTFQGYIDELRITNGVCRYTTDFSVPTDPFPDKLI